MLSDRNEWKFPNWSKLNLRARGGECVHGEAGPPELRARGGEPYPGHRHHQEWNIVQELHRGDGENLWLPSGSDCHSFSCWASTRLNRDITNCVCTNKKEREIVIANSMFAEQMGRGRGRKKYLVISNDRGARSGECWSRSSEGWSRSWEREDSLLGAGEAVKKAFSTKTSIKYLTVNG